MNFIFHNIWDVILPIDFHIFQRGRSTTNQDHLWPSIFDRYMSWMLLAVCVAMTAYWPLREFNMETGGFFMDDVACHSLQQGGIGRTCHDTIWHISNKMIEKCRKMWKISTTKLSQPSCFGRFSRFMISLPARHGDVLPPRRRSTTSPAFSRGNDSEKHGGGGQCFFPAAEELDLLVFVAFVGSVHFPFVCETLADQGEWGSNLAIHFSIWIIWG